MSSLTATPPSWPSRRRCSPRPTAGSSDTSKRRTALRELEALAEILEDSELEVRRRPQRLGASGLTVGGAVTSGGRRRAPCAPSTIPGHVSVHADAHNSARVLGSRWPLDFSGGSRGRGRLPFRRPRLRSGGVVTSGVVCRSSIGL